MQSTKTHSCWLNNTLGGDENEKRVELGLIVWTRTAHKRRESQASVQIPCTAILHTSTAIHQPSYSQLALVSGDPTPIITGGGGRLGIWVSVGIEVGFWVRWLPVSSRDSSEMAASKSADTGTQGRGHTHTRHDRAAASTGHF